MQGRADALVGLRACHDQPARCQVGQHRFQRGLLERVGVALVHKRLIVAGRQLRHDQPLVAALGQVVAGMLHPDDRDIRLPGLLDEAGDVGHHRIPLVRSADDSVLHVDDQQSGIRPVLQRGHVITCPRVAAACRHASGRP
jgi:hypothetical protein